MFAEAAAFVDWGGGDVISSQPVCSLRCASTGAVAAMDSCMGSAEGMSCLWQKLPGNDGVSE